MCETDIDYSDLRDYNAALGKISSKLNQWTQRVTCIKLMLRKWKTWWNRCGIHRSPCFPDSPVWSINHPPVQYNCNQISPKIPISKIQKWSKFNTKKVHCNSVLIWFTVHLDVCSMLSFFYVLILSLCIFRFIFIALCLLVFKPSLLLLTFQQELNKKAKKELPWFSKPLHKYTKICLLHNGFFLLPMRGNAVVRQILITIYECFFCHLEIDR